VTSKQDKLYRLIDANLNRLREGLRVCEDIERYIYDNKELSKKIKTLRHQVKIENFETYLKSRDIVGDVSKETIKSESDKKDIKSLQISNIKRAQESARVLEESFKLIDQKIAEKFKNIRYELYDMEKEILL
jgi:thiamine-phosphate pyrophosphorylase